MEVGKFWRKLEEGMGNELDQNILSECVKFSKNI